MLEVFWLVPALAQWGPSWHTSNRKVQAWALATLLGSLANSHATDKIWPQTSGAVLSNAAGVAADRDAHAGSINSPSQPFYGAPAQASVLDTVYVFNVSVQNATTDFNNDHDVMTVENQTISVLSELLHKFGTCMQELQHNRAAVIAEHNKYRLCQVEKFWWKGNATFLQQLLSKEQAEAQRLLAQLRNTEEEQEAVVVELRGTVDKLRAQLLEKSAALVETEQDYQSAIGAAEVSNDRAQAAEALAAVERQAARSAREEAATAIAQLKEQHAHQQAALEASLRAEFEQVALEQAAEAQQRQAAAVAAEQAAAAAAAAALQAADEARAAALEARLRQEADTKLEEQRSQLAAGCAATLTEAASDAAEHARALTATLAAQQASAAAAAAAELQAARVDMAAVCERSLQEQRSAEAERELQLVSDTATARAAAAAAERASQQSVAMAEEARREQGVCEARAAAADAAYQEQAAGMAGELKRVEAQAGEWRAKYVKMVGRVNDALSHAQRERLQELMAAVHVTTHAMNAAAATASA